jgi:hypothetical protein
MSEYRIHVIFLDKVESYYEYPSWDAAVAISEQIAIENPILMEIQVNCPIHGWTHCEANLCDWCGD